MDRNNSPGNVVIIAVGFAISLGVAALLPLTTANPEFAAAVKWFVVLGHFAILFAALLLIVFMGRELAKVMDYSIHRLGVPAALGGIVIAMLTLTPESVSAFRAALDDKLQHSVNVFLDGRA